MKKIISLVILILSLSLSVGCSSNDKLKELTKEEKVEDFDYYINTMKDNYCNFDVFYNKSNIEYLDFYEILKEEIENSDNNKEFYDIMNYSISLLNDGHTNLINPSNVDWYRRVYNSKYQEDILNDEIFTDKNKKWENYLNEDNKLNRVYKKVNDKVSDYNKDNIETKIIDEDIAYMKINSFLEFNKEDTDKIKDLYKTLDNYNNYIIDIRGNVGGNSLLWMNHIVKPIVNNTYESTTYELHKEGKITKDYYSSRGIDLKDIKKFPKKGILKKVKNIDDYKYYSEYNMKFTNKSIWEGGEDKKGYNGNIYLLVDKNSFSSSEAFAVFCKNSGWATVVGNQNSGGDGVGIDPIVFSLTNSGLVVRSTAGKGLNKDGSSNLEEGTSLDLYMNSLDDLIEYIKKEEKL
ncbi:S41 family peptidase [[Clostridium] dakarense]|uniref:S41 family peptidase n=1 Tax=Faecalimicrobium dakarense TaxID=1301100 RepID=UPI0004BCF0C7|nr:S41 family peptidase [[Clostridium] dakarense]